MSEETQGSWLESGAYSLLEKGAGLVFGLGSLFLLTRALTKLDFGLWLAFGIICAMVEVGRAGLQQNAFVKYLSVAKDDKEKGEITTASLFNSLSITLLVIIALFFFGELLEKVFKDSQGLAELLKIYCLTTFFLVFFQQYNFTQQSNFKFEGIFWSNLTYKASFFIFILVLYLKKIEPSLPQLAWFQVIASIGAAFVAWLFAKPYLRFSRRINFSWVKELFDFGRYGFGTNMSTMLHKNLDKIMLGNMLGSSFLGIYEWAVRLTLLIEVPTFSVASVVYPKSSQRVDQGGKEGLRDLYEKSVGAILAIILPFIILVVVLAYPIIFILATEKYIEAVPVLRITMLFGLFIPYAVMFGTVIDSMGKPRLNFFFTLGGFLTNIVANYICILNFGVIGAAYGTLFSWAVLTFSGQIVLAKSLGVRYFKPWTYIFPFYRDAIQKLLVMLNENILAREKKK